MIHDERIDLIERRLDDAEARYREAWQAYESFRGASSHPECIRLLDAAREAGERVEFLARRLVVMRESRT